MAGRRRWRIRARPGVHRVRAFMGVPFLHPRANRTRGYKYRTGGHDVTLDRASQLLLLDDHGLPIHGVLTASSRASVCASVAGDERARLIASLDFDTPELSGGHRQRIVLAPRALLLARRSNTPVAVSAWLECVALRIAGPMQQSSPRGATARSRRDADPARDPDRGVRDRTDADAARCRACQSVRPRERQDLRRGGWR